MAQKRKARKPRKNPPQHSADLVIPVSRRNGAEAAPTHCIHGTRWTEYCPECWRAVAGDDGQQRAVAGDAYPIAEHRIDRAIEPEDGVAAGSVLLLGVFIGCVGGMFLGGALVWAWPHVMTIFS